MLLLIELGMGEREREIDRIEGRKYWIYRVRILFVRHITKSEAAIRTN
jgi:hypothetical protein